nr:uncharacterized protein C1orf232 homolog [Chrysemys picta bellii]
MTQGFWKVYKSKVLQTLGSEGQEEEFKDEGQSQPVFPGATPAAVHAALLNMRCCPMADAVSLFQGDNPELVETTDAPVLMEEGSNPISQLARRVQGAGARGWRSMSSLFNREDEHKLLTPEPCADHPPQRAVSGFPLLRVSGSLCSDAPRPLISPSLASSPLAPKPAESPSAEKTTSGFWDVFATKWQQASALDKKTAPPEFSEPAAEFSGAPGEPPGEEPTYSNNGSDLREPEEGAFKWGFLVSKLAEIRNKNAPKSN